MSKSPILIWIVLSFASLLIGVIWRQFDSSSEIATGLYFVGWISSLLAIGYFSTPTGSMYGKIAFGCVALMVTGIVMKILHLTGANEIIIIGLLGIGAAYGVMWFKDKKQPEGEQ